MLGARTRAFAVSTLLLVAIGMTACCSDLFDRRYIYFPSRWEARDWKALSGLPLEDVWLTTTDGVRLHGWYVEASDRRAVLLWCHGNAGNIIHRLENLGELHRRGLSVFIFDYRGYGQSAGRPSEPGLYLDALAAYDYLVQERRVSPAELVVFGRSLGAAVAGEVARQRPIAGLILETPLPSVKAVARQAFGGLPVEGLVRARFDLVKRLREVRVPVLILHGDHDDVIPFALGQAVYAAAQEPKRFYRIPGAGHNDTYVVGGEAYFQQLLQFVHEVSPRAHPP
jgi:fermentation-respiration switch protein FrsA (DUF1100 family)